MKLLGLRFSLSFWICLAAVVIGLGNSGRAASREGGQGPLVGKKAPAFHVQGIFDESYSLEAFKGHILVMQFGTSW